MKLMLIAAALLAGCATAPQADPNAAFARDREAAGRNCTEGTPQIARTLLSAHLGNVQSGRPSIEQLADPTIPSAEEKSAIKALAEQRDQCRERLAQVHDRYGFGGAASILRATFPALRATYADLYAGAITYGEANKRFDEIQTRAVEAINEYGRALDSQQAQAAEQRRLAALQMFQQWNLNTRPRTTNCVRVGNQAQCTSY